VGSAGLVVAVGEMSGGWVITAGPQELIAKARMSKADKNTGLLLDMLGLLFFVQFKIINTKLNNRIIANSMERFNQILNHCYLNFKSEPIKAEK